MSINHSVITCGVLLAVALAACGGNEGTGSTTSGTGGAAGQGGAGAGGTGTGGGMPMPPQAFVRLGHLSPGAPPVDLCANFGDGKFIGPLLKFNGVANSLAYLDVTGAFPFPAGPITYRAIPADATSCDAAITGAQDSMLQTSPGQLYTFVLVGQPSPPQGSKIEFKEFVDDPVPAAGKLKLRVVHLSPDTPSADIGTGSANTFMALFTDVAYGAEGTASGKTYLELPPLTNSTLSVRQHGLTMDVVVTPPVTLGDGVIATAFLIGDFSGSPKPLKLLVCTDNGPKKNFTYTPCSILP